MRKCIGTQCKAESDEMNEGMNWSVELNEVEDKQSTASLNCNKDAKPSPIHQVQLTKDICM